jgi:hypothetical protein
MQRDGRMTEEKFWVRPQKFILLLFSRQQRALLNSVVVIMLWESGWDKHQKSYVTRLRYVTGLCHSTVWGKNLAVKSGISFWVMMAGASAGRVSSLVSQDLFPNPIMISFDEPCISVGGNLGLITISDFIPVTVMIRKWGGSGRWCRVDFSLGHIAWLILWRGSESDSSEDNSMRL